MNKNETPSISAESFDQLVQEVAAIQQSLAQLQDKNRELTKRVLQLETEREASATPPVIQENLPESQKAVLQAILDLPEDAFADAEKLMITIEGQPMTAAFCNSMKAVLKLKKWGVVCTTCEKASSIMWITNPKYAEGGVGQYSHSGPSPHGSITTIRNLKFIKRTDGRRKKQS